MTEELNRFQRIKSLLQDTNLIDSHTISLVVAECDMALTQRPAAQTEREAFEGWARPNGYDLRRNDVLGHYSSIDTSRAWSGFRAGRASLPAHQQATPAQEVHPLASRCYAMSEPHLSGYRLVLGFETLEAVGAAHTWVANVRKAPQQATPEPLIVKGAMTGMVDAQVRDLWPTKKEQATPERHLTVTTNQQGEAVMVSWQDDEHRILDVVWERKPATPEPVQDDSSEHLRVIASLGAALRRLSFAAQTSGGTAGPDAELMAAIGQAKQALSYGGIGQAMFPATPEPVGEVVAWWYFEDGDVKFGHPSGHRPDDARPLIFADTHPAPGVPEGVPWRPIETAPKDGAMVDLWAHPYTGSALRLTDVWWTDRTGWRNGACCPRIAELAKRATHWTRPPAAPPLAAAQAKGGE